MIFERSKVTGLTPDIQAYVDAVAVGLRQFKASARAATTVAGGNITLSGAQTIDGVSVIAGDRVLVKNQSTGSQNGIYVCAAGAWSRATDADISAEVLAGLYIFVDEGSTNADSGWVLATNNPIVLGTTALTFTKFTSIGGDVVGPASSTDNGLPRFDGTGGKTLQTSGLVLTDADLLEIPNTAGGGLHLLNTASKTDYERLRMSWSSNQLQIRTEAGGSGTSFRDMLMGPVGGATCVLGATGLSSINGNTSASSTPAISLTNGTMTSTTLAQTLVSMTGTVNQASGSGSFTGLLINPTLTAVGSGGAKLLDVQASGVSRFSVASSGTTSVGGACNVTSHVQLRNGTALPAGGTAGQGLQMFSVTNFGVFGGSGTPTLSAHKGSLYLRSDGSGTNDRAYINTDGGTTWTALVTVA